MRNVLTILLVAASSCFSFSAPADEGAKAKLKSGPTVGTLPRVFYVKDCTGKFTKEIKTCYRCNYGPRPVVSVFARELDQDTIKLLQNLDKTVAAHAKSEKNGAKQLAAFFVMVTDNPDAAEARIKRMQRKLKLKNVPLTVFDGSKGPAGYQLGREAAVTVSMWSSSAVKSNHAFRTAKDLKDDAIKKVLLAAAKIAPTKKPAEKPE